MTNNKLCARLRGNMGGNNNGFAAEHRLNKDMYSIAKLCARVHSTVGGIGHDLGSVVGGMVVPGTAPAQMALALPLALHILGRLQGLKYFWAQWQ